MIDTSAPWVPLEYYHFNSLLITLLVLHVYWWLLICRMIAKQLRNSGHVGGDVRSGTSWGMGDGGWGMGVGV